MRPIPLDLNNKLKPIWSIVPGWHQFAGSVSTAGGQAVSDGVDRRLFVASGSGSSQDARILRTSYWNGSPVATAYNNSIDTTNGTALRNTDNDLFINKTAFTLVGIFRPIGNGTAGGTGDPRVFSKDIGSGEADHDLMIGGVRATTAPEFRTRVRIGTSTLTVVTSGSEWQTDAWNLVAVTVNPSGANSTVRVIGIRQDGALYSNSASQAGVYNPRTTTDIALFSNGVSNQNMLDGEILSVTMFDGVLSDLALRSFFANPWQVFKPQLRLVPTYPYDPTKVVAVEAPAGDTLTITLVDVAGTPLTGLTGLSWAWFDESDVNLASTPTATGTGATTDGSGVFSVDITGTTLTTGQTGMLALMDSTGYTYALYKVTLT